MLASFRSPHDNTSWVTSLGAVLDGATLVLACFEEEREGAAHTMHATGTHAIEDLGYFFDQPAWRSMIDRSEFGELRETYGERLNALAGHAGRAAHGVDRGPFGRPHSALPGPAAALTRPRRAERRPGCFS